MYAPLKKASSVTIQSEIPKTFLRPRPPNQLVPKQRPWWLLFISFVSFNDTLCVCKIPTCTHMGTFHSFHLKDLRDGYPWLLALTLTPSSERKAVLLELAQFPAVCTCNLLYLQLFLLSPPISTEEMSVFLFRVNPFTPVLDPVPFH